MPRYEFSEGSSNKFWDITLTGKSFTTTYGKIGASGQTTIKSFKSDADAKKEHDKLVAEKTKKGYVLVGGKAKAKAGKADKADAKPNGKPAKEAAPAPTGKRDARNKDLEAAILARRPGSATPATRTSRPRSSRTRRTARPTRCSPTGCRSRATRAAS